MTQRPEHEVEVRLTEIEQILIRKNNRYSLHDSSLTYARRTAAHHCTQDEEQSSRSRLYHHLHTKLRNARDTLGTSGPQDEQKVRIAREWLDAHAQELQSAAHASSTDKWQDTAEFLHAVGESLYLDNRYIEADELFRTVLTTAAPGSLGQANATYNLGDVHRMQGRYDEATTAYHDALTTYQALGVRLGQANTTDSLGDVHQQQGRYDEATTAYQNALTTYQAIGNRLGQANAAKGLGDVHRLQGRYDEAVGEFQKALTTYQAIGDLLGQAGVIYSLGDVHRLQGRYDEAVGEFQKARDLYTELGITEWADRCQLAVSKIEAARAKGASSG